MSDTLPEFLTTDEAAAVMRRSRSYVQKLCKSGELKAKKVGEWRVHRDDLVEFLRPAPIVRSRRRAS